MVDEPTSPGSAEPGREAPDAADVAGAALTADSHAQMEEFRRARETQVLTILLSDLEGSTRQQGELGNVRAAELVRTHRAVFRETLRDLDGREIETAGDSFLVVFAAPSEAVRFALRMQGAMRAAREKEPLIPGVRVGIHQGQVVVERHDEGPKKMEIYGLQVSTAARIMDLGRGGQVLCSRAIFDDARAILRGDDLAGLGPVAWRNHGPYRFKGVDDSYDVCEIGEEGAAPLEAPPAGSKSWPADRSDEELGWRPAAGVVVPGTNWVLEERLGRDTSEKEARARFRGEFGEVWKAWNRSDKSHQVYKFCFKRDRVPALKREARLLKRLRKYHHPNLAEVYDVTEADRPPYYLEMEYVEGPSLEEWLAGAPPLEERLEVVAQVADALDAVHAAGIYHRDIKPANILLTHREDGALQAKLTDFGLGSAEDEDLLKSIYTSRVEGVAGTWDYIAPELRRGEAASAQSDLYSLGVTLFQIAVGDLRRPLGDWEGQVGSDILREDIRKCIASDPARRWARAADLAKALRSHDERVERLRLEKERARARERARRLRRVLAGAGVAAAVVLAWLVSWWRTPGTLEVDVGPPGARIEIAGRVLTAGEKPIPLDLPAGYYEVRIEAADHVGETRAVAVERGKSRHFPLTLVHEQGALDAECDPVGSEIEVDGVAYGSRVRNLKLDTGPHRLLAWSNGRFEGGRAVRIEVDRTRGESFCLDRGVLWKYTSPWVQGAAFFVADVDGDGVPDIAHNELSRVELLSGADGGPLPYRLPAPGSGSRSVQLIDLGGEVGPALVAGMEVPGSGLDVFAIRTAAPTEFLWRWRGPGRDWRAPSGSWPRAAGDLNGDGVAELAVPSRDGRLYVLDGRAGEQLHEVPIIDMPLRNPFGLEVVAGADGPTFVYLTRTDDPAAQPERAPGRMRRGASASTGPPSGGTNSGPWTARPSAISTATASPRYSRGRAASGGCWTRLPGASARAPRSRAGYASRDAP